MATDWSIAPNTLEFLGQTYLDGRASDPKSLGWMEGSPPSPEKSVTFEDDQFFQFPQIRWTLTHMRELMPTARVGRGRSGDRFGEPDGAVAAAIEKLVFTDSNGRTRRWEEALLDTYTDGIVVLHRGRLVYERYFGTLASDVPHACFSITKSYAGTLAASFVHEKILDDKRLITHYVPELSGTGWGNATLRQVMDMQTGLAYSEDYSDACASIWKYSRACGMRPKSRDPGAPRSLCEYLRTIGKHGTHGDTFAYKTVNTEVMSWVMSRVTGRTFVQLLHEHLWEPLGCEEDGYVVVDSVGVPMAGGGLNATLRDLARFGELMRREGDWAGRQLIPSAVVHQLKRGGDAEKFAKGESRMPGYSYRDMWWISGNELGAIEARGIHGQRLYVAPKAEMIIARFSSFPIAAPYSAEPISPPLFLALGRMLRG